jgi:hypothetical protein
MNTTPEDRTIRSRPPRVTYLAEDGSRREGVLEFGLDADLSQLVTALTAQGSVRHDKRDEPATASSMRSSSS